MAGRNIDMLVHLVWETERRRNVIAAELEQTLHDAVRDALDDIGLDPLAVGSAWDHVHALVGWDTSVAFVDAVDECKRRARLRWSAERHAREGTAEELAWEDGYASTGVQPDELLDVTRYIDLQRELHGEGRMWPRFERGGRDRDAQTVRTA